MLEDGPVVSGSDQDLLARFAASGEEVVFTQLVERHGALVLAACQRVLRDRHDAEDAAQAVLIALSREAPRLVGHPSLPGWLCRTAWNVSTRLARARSRRGRHERQALPAVAAPSADEDRQEGLQRALNALPEPYRLAVIMHHLEGRTLEEMAQACGCSASAISMRLTRAKQRLRRILGEGAERFPAGWVLALGVAHGIQQDAHRRAQAALHARGTVVRQAMRWAREGHDHWLVGGIIGGLLLLVVVMWTGSAATRVRMSPAPTVHLEPRPTPPMAVTAQPPLPTMTHSSPDPRDPLEGGLRWMLYANGGNLYPQTLTLDADGRAWIGGYGVADVGATAGVSQGFVVCMTPHGAVSIGGKKLWILPEERVLQLVTTPDHHFVALATKPYACLLRFDTTVHRDRSFGKNGEVRLPVDAPRRVTPEELADPAAALLRRQPGLVRPALAIDHDGRLLVVGSSGPRPVVVSVSSRGAIESVVPLGEIDGSLLGVAVTSADTVVATGFVTPGPRVLTVALRRTPALTPMFVHVHAFPAPGVGTAVVGDDDDGYHVAGETLATAVGPAADGRLVFLSHVQLDGTEPGQEPPLVLDVGNPAAAGERQESVSALRVQQQRVVLSIADPSLPSALLAVRNGQILRSWGDGTGWRPCRIPPPGLLIIRDFQVAPDHSLWMVAAETEHGQHQLSLLHLFADGAGDNLSDQGQ